MTKMSPHLLNFLKLQWEDIRQYHGLRRMPLDWEAVADIGTYEDFPSDAAYCCDSPTVVIVRLFRCRLFASEDVFAWTWRTIWDGEEGCPDGLVYLSREESEKEAKKFLVEEMESYCCRFSLCEVTLLNFPQELPRP